MKRKMVERYVVLETDGVLYYLPPEQSNLIHNKLEIVTYCDSEAEARKYIHDNS